MPGRRIVRHSLTARRRAVGRAVTAAVALAASVLAVSVPAAAQTQTPPFSDTADAYYSQAVDALAADGIFDGTECAPGMLCPEDSIDRKTMAVWVVRTLDSEDPAEIPNSRFSDVASVSFHAPFIERMAQLGVTAGCGNGNFCPDGTVDRYQMAVFLTKAFDLEPGPDPGFTDVAADAWYHPQVAALAASGITAGCSNDKFCPNSRTERGQMALFLAKATGILELPTTTLDLASPYPFTVILPNTIVEIDNSGQRHTIRAKATVTYYEDDDYLDPSVSISPDGRRVAYWNRDGLFVTNRDGTDTKQINNSDFHGWSPDGWSPDSRWFAYSTEPQFDVYSYELLVPGGFFVTNLDGTDTKEIHKGVRWITSTWSPDSTRIAYWIGEDDGSLSDRGLLAVYSLDGSGTQMIANIIPDGEAVVGFSWSPDSSRIAYTTNDGYRVSNADGTDARDLVDRAGLHRGELLSPTTRWSPDGSHIVLASGRSDGTEYHSDDYITRVEGTDLIDSYSLYDIFPSSLNRRVRWSQDGRLVAYSAYLGSDFAVLSTSEGGQILSLEELQDYDSDQRYAEVERSSEWQRSLGRFYGFSPDGRNILSVSNNNDGSLILTVSSSDYEFAMSNPDSVLRFELYVGPGRYDPGRVTFSPDGTKIVYMSSNGITTIDLTNGEESHVLDYSDIIADAGTEMHVCGSDEYYEHRAYESLQWTQSGIRATAVPCSTP